MGYLLLGIYFNLSIWFKITDKTNYSFWITLIGALVSIGVIVGLVPKFGFIGGALSTLACYGTMSLICFVFGQKYYPIPYQTYKGLLYLLVAFGLSYLGFLMNFENSVLNFLSKNSFLLLFSLLIFVLEKNQILAFFPKNRKSSK
jgi:O-antigen/teichoic acid export membrane protein